MTTWQGTFIRYFSTFWICKTWNLKFILSIQTLHSGLCRSLFGSSYRLQSWVSSYRVYNWILGSLWQILSGGSQIGREYLWSTIFRSLRGLSLVWSVLTSFPVPAAEKPDPQSNAATTMHHCRDGSTWVVLQGLGFVDVGTLNIFLNYIQSDPFTTGGLQSRARLWILKQKAPDQSLEPKKRVTF